MTALLTTNRVLLALILIVPNALSSSERFLRHDNPRFRFTLLIPSSWERHEIDLKYKQILILKKNQEAEILISSMKSDSEEKIKWETWKEWYVKNTGSGLREIFETSDFIIRQNITGKLIIFEFTIQDRRLLQRVMIARIGESLIVIECRAGIKLFSRHSDIFDTVMASLKSGG